MTQAKRTPTLNATASSLSPAGVATDSATLGNGSGPAGPTGTITFKLYGPDNPMCGGTPLSTSTKSVAGNGVYVSDPVTPSAPGTYVWVTSYSGDANNNRAEHHLLRPRARRRRRSAASVHDDHHPAPVTTTTTVALPPPSQTVPFVERAYRDFLGRSPSSGETEYWVGALARGVSRTSMATALTTGSEFRRLVIASYFRTYLGRPASPAEADPSRAPSTAAGPSSSWPP